MGACGTIIQVEYESLRNISDGFLSLIEAYNISKISAVLIPLASNPGLAVAGHHGHSGDFGTKMNRIFARLTVSLPTSARSPHPAVKLCDDLVLLRSVFDLCAWLNPFLTIPLFVVQMGLLVCPTEEKLNVSGPIRYVKCAVVFNLLCKGSQCIVELCPAWPIWSRNLSPSTQGTRPLLSLATGDSVCL